MLTPARRRAARRAGHRLRTALPDVEVLWVSFYPENWGLHADLDVLDAMAEQPERAEVLLTDAAPATFHCSWALLVDRDRGMVLHRSALAPIGTQVPPGVFGDLGTAHVADLPADWHDGWGEAAIAVAPCRSRPQHRGRTPGGPSSARPSWPGCATWP